MRIEKKKVVLEKKRERFLYIYMYINIGKSRISRFWNKKREKKISLKKIERILIFIEIYL